jgi:hypothetical protein
MPMAEDSIVNEVRQARDALGRRFDFDLRAMIEDARKRQAAGGRRVVSFPPRPPRKPAPVQFPKQGMPSAEMPEPS